jgi:hypothetical protein
MSVGQKIRECIKSARHDFIRFEKASAWLHGYPESNTDQIENELERDALNVVIGSVAFTNAIEKKYGKPNPLTGGYDNCKDFNGLGTANFHKGLEVLSFEVSISFFREVAHQEGNGALVELIDSCIQERHKILGQSVASVAPHSGWADLFENRYSELHPKRAKAVRSWLEVQGSFQIAANPLGYEFRTLKNEIAGAHKIVLTQGLSKPAAWLESVFIRQGEGIEGVRREATLAELTQWNKKFFAGLKPLTLGGDFDVSARVDYNDALEGTGFSIVEGGLERFQDDENRIIKTLIDTHRELLSSAVSSGQLKLEPPAGMELATAAEMQLAKNPSEMSRWQLSLEGLEKYLQNLGDNWRLVGPSSTGQGTQSPGYFLEMTADATIDLNSLTREWFYACRGREMSILSSPFFYEWVANENEVLAAVQRCELPLVNPSAYLNLGNRSEVLVCRVSVETATAFLRKRGVTVGVIQSQIYDNAVNGGEIQTGRTSKIGEVAKVVPVQKEQGTQSTGIWGVKRPKRFIGYTLPLYNFANAAFEAGELLPPKAMDVIEAWRVNKPLDIEQVLDKEIIYSSSQGTTKSANLKAIQQAINNLVTLA